MLSMTVSNYLFRIFGTLSLCAHSQQELEHTPHSIPCAQAIRTKIMSAVKTSMAWVVCALAPPHHWMKP